MIRYSLDMEIKGINPELDHRDVLVFTGSCFSDHIASRLQALYFKVYSQPNGVVFNPVSLADPFLRILEDRNYSASDLTEYNGVWHSKFHHGSFSSADRELVLSQVNGELSNLKESLAQAKYLFVTFGSAYVYEWTQTEEIVANCHKIPQSSFSKKLLSAENISSLWLGILAKLKIQYPQLNCVFTVSPVKHLRDGVIENTVSKSVLFVALQQIKESGVQYIYFPAYELINDDLRDYRFYEADGAHPSQLGIEYVFDRFTGAFFSRESDAYHKSVQKYLQLSAHRPFKTEGEEYHKFLHQLNSLKKELENKYAIKLD